MPLMALTATASARVQASPTDDDGGGVLRAGQLTAHDIKATAGPEAKVAGLERAAAARRSHSAEEEEPPVLPLLQEDVLRQLRLRPDVLLLRQSFNRPNIAYEGAAVKGWGLCGWVGPGESIC